MRSRRKVVVGALSAVAALVLAACGGGNVASSGGSGSGGGGGGAADANGVHNPSTAKGGTLRFANSGDWDSLDPADTYYAYSWDFIRLYGRSLVMFKSAPGKDGATLVPDLAESLGKSSDNAKTWTYTLRKGVKFEDGTPVTSKDVKYAVERSLDKTTFPNGPTYFNDFLDLQGYTTPYEDPSPDKLGLKAIETPDDQTIVFKLKSPFCGLRLLRPAAVDDPGARGQGHRQQVQGARGLHGPVHVRHERARQELHAQAQPQLGPGDRPQPPGAAGPLRGHAQRQRRRRRQPAAVR